MCENFFLKSKDLPIEGNKSKIALKGQFYVIMIGVEVEITKIHPNNHNTIVLEN